MEKVCNPELMKNPTYLLITIGLSTAYWILESSIHWLVFTGEFEIIPDDPNELWMRLLLILLFIVFGLYVDYKTAQLNQKEQEKRRIFNAAVQSTQHILNNLLNQIMYIKMQLEEDEVLSDELKQTLEDILASGSNQVQALSQVEDMSEDAIRQSVYPQGK